MRIHLVAVGQRMPKWVNEGFAEYAQRMPPECPLQLVELPLAPRAKNTDIVAAMRKEGEAMWSATPKGANIIALEVKGASWSTEQLSRALDKWLHDGRDLALWIGGPDGIHAETSARAAGQWSLSPLTLPHPLVRVVVAEQLYRAWSVLRNHPYHRA
jgi:23S rRNA (pseudouridine1915-N3)-methyltransferase